MKHRSPPMGGGPGDVGWQSGGAECLTRRPPPGQRPPTLRDRADLARALGGHVDGRVVFAPEPGQPSIDRGLRVCIDPDAPDGFLLLTRTIDRATARAHVIERVRKWKAEDSPLPLFDGGAL